MTGQLTLGSEFEALQPAMGVAGEWGTVGGFAVREALSRGSLDAVMDVLDGMDGTGIAALLREAGFAVGEGTIERGRDAVLAQVQNDLIEAVNRRVDGFEVRAGRPAEPDIFAAKEQPAVFRGDSRAMDAIQQVLRAPQVQVDLFGSVIPAERASLQFVAGQAMEAGIQGFAFDGLPGKYQVDFGLQEIQDLHATASAVIAVETVREAVDVWRREGQVGPLPNSIPGSIQQVLQSSLSEEGAKVLIRAVEEGSVAEYARETGAHAIQQTLAAQGLDVNAPTVDQQAQEFGLLIADPDLQRGKYAGAVVAMDHCAALVKYSRDRAIVLPFSQLAQDQKRPGLGDLVRVEFNKGELSFKGAEAGVSADRGR